MGIFSRVGYKIKAIILITLVLFYKSVIALPNNPISLPVLIDQSDVVALVSVDSIDRWTTSPDGMSFSTKSIATAFLKVLKVYKGKLEIEQLNVNYWVNIACPTPPRFHKSDSTIIFLTKKLEANEYSVPFLSYGTIVVNDLNKYNAYNHAIESYMKLELGNSEKKIRAWHKWIKNCALNGFLINEIDIFYRSMGHNKKNDNAIQERI